jgi:hypothetical protein
VPWDVPVRPFWAARSPATLVNTVDERPARHRDIVTTRIYLRHLSKLIADLPWDDMTDERLLDIAIGTGDVMRGRLDHARAAMLVLRGRPDEIAQVCLHEDLTADVGNQWAEQLRVDVEAAMHAI